MSCYLDFLFVLSVVFVVLFELKFFASFGS